MRTINASSHRSAVSDGFDGARPRRWLLVAASLVALVVSLGSVARADRIILRNLKTYNEPVVAFNEDGVSLKSGTIVTWDEVEAGTVAPADQERFDKMLDALGEPLYRVRQRLSTGDFEGVLASAEQMYPVYVRRDSPTAYLVFQALMWGRLEAGRREAAVEPYFRALEYLRGHDGRLDQFPGERRLQVDMKTGLTPELTPVWFDADAARAALPGVREAVRAMKSPRPAGAYLIYATLALAAGETEEAQRFLSTIDDSVPVLTQLRDIALAQQEIQSGKRGPAVQKIEASVDSLLPQARPLARYWLGKSQTDAEDASQRLEGVLELLHVPALYGKQFPELAAAGLYDAMRVLQEIGDNPGSIALRRELLDEYPGTVYANKVKAASALP